MYTSAYAAIREDPSFKPTEKDAAKWKAESSKQRTPKLTREQRRQRVEEKIAAYKAGKADAEEDEDEE
jgi:large subunit ribosomal protein L5e